MHKINNAKDCNPDFIVCVGSCFHYTSTDIDPQANLQISVTRTSLKCIVLILKPVKILTTS